MDKRIIILIVVFVAFAAGFFVYRKMYYKHDGIRYEVRPRGIIKVADSIAYQDLTPGATRWKWDFGDGEYSSDQFGSHAYLEPGQFNVRLTVYGPFGVLQDSRAVVNVIPGELIADASEPQIVGPQDPKAGQQARYASSINAASYEWTVEGDPALAARRQSGSSAEYSFGRPGRRTLVLTMHNPDHVVRKDISVVADAAPQPAAVQQPRPAPVTRPAPMRQPPSQPKQSPPKKGNGLPDLGEGVEYEKK